MNIFNKIINGSYNNVRFSIKRFAKTILPSIALAGCIVIFVYTLLQAGTLPSGNYSGEVQEIIFGQPLVDQPFLGTFPFAHEYGVNTVHSFVMLAFSDRSGIKKVSSDSAEQGSNNWYDGILDQLHNPLLPIYFLIGFMIGFYSGPRN